MSAVRRSAPWRRRDVQAAECSGAGFGCRWSPLTIQTVGVGTVVYTDGACLGNPGPGGWAWAVPDGPYRSGAEERSTNQRMEISAVLEALRALDGEVHVMSDSTYVVNCFRDRWWEGWLKRGWQTSQRKPVANRDLWEPLIELYRKRSDQITFEWVKGHATDPVNDIVDRLAVQAAQTQQARSGTGMPEDLGDPDVPTDRGARDPRLPAGRLLLVTGHRPSELGGYGDNPVAERVRRRLVEILAAKRELYPDLTVVTGLNLGAEQLGATAAREASVPYVGVLGFPEQEAVWPPASQRTFQELVEGAERTVLLEKKAPASRQQVAAALRRRNGWLANQVDEAVVVWDGSDEAIGRTVRSLEDRLEDVWIVDPHEE